MAGQTPSQTVGPFFHDGLIRADGAVLVGEATEGERILIVGRVLDGDGRPVPDAMVEIWQADSAGRYGADSEFIGFGRGATGEDGAFRFLTIRPGRVAGPGNSLQAPHIAVGVLGRGLLKRLTTRLYFADSPDNADDPILALVPDDRRDTLIARRDGEAWRFDIILQGDDETVFFDC
jgi:protocatechuate 3,4-dioxygenase alpha subunit